METCTEKLSEMVVHDVHKSGRVFPVEGGNIQSRTCDMGVGFNDENPVSDETAINNACASSSSSAKYNAKKTDSLKQQSSVDSGVHMDVGTCQSPDMLTGKVSARKKELTSFQEQQKKKDICDKTLHNISGIVQARSAVLSAAQQEETKPKCTTSKKTHHHPPPISTSNEHSTNYQKAMAFWKR
jgi:TolA-binding protein